MRAVAMVAHPDDCVIYAYGFIQAYPELEWTICYLTYTATDYRGREFFKFWQRRGRSTVFLGYPDTYQDLLNDQVSFDQGAAADSITSVIKDFDLVLTHDHHGDYGHPHHRFVNQVVCSNHSHVVCFAGAGQGTHKYFVEPGSYDLSEFPQHQDVVAGVHPFQHINEYTVTERVAKIL